MKYSQLILTAMLGALGMATANAVPTAAEVAELGKSLTPFGAIKAGNKEGTIPEWTGGLCKPPANYKPSRSSDVGGGPWADPYANEKPLFKITAANMAQYANKLDPGTQELLRRYPDYYLNVYPSHRSACFPNYMYENTIKRVMNPKIVGMDIAPSLTGAHAQIPFPIPKNGYEAMWNSNVKPEPLNTKFNMDTWMADSSGNIIFQNTQDVRMNKPYWDNSVNRLPDDKHYWALMSRVVVPAAQVGTNQLRLYYERQDLRSGSTTWQYIPGQRRVRVAPEFAYDGVSVTSGGMLLFDEINGFDGKMDRFDFKLEGRKEVYLPYNSWKFVNADAKEVMLPTHGNPESLRYELHRVWVVHAVLKPGERHVQREKWFYIDEDTWNILSVTGIDQAGKPMHYLNWPIIQAYEVPESRINNYYLYDFSKRRYSITTWTRSPQGAAEGYAAVKAYPKNFFTPDSMAGSGVR